MLSLFETAQAYSGESYQQASGYSGEAQQNSYNDYQYSNYSENYSEPSSFSQNTMDIYNTQEKNIFTFGERGKGVEDFFMGLLDLIWDLLDKGIYLITEIVPWIISAFFIYAMIRIFIISREKSWQEAGGAFQKDFEKFLSFGKKGAEVVWKGICAFFRFFKTKKWVAISLIAVFFVIYTAGHLNLVKILRVYPGQKAVDVISGEVLEPGTHFFSPLSSSYIITHSANYEHQVRRITADSSELQDVVIDMNITIRFADDKSIVDFYRTHKYDMSIAKTAQQIVSPKVEEEVKKIIIDYSFKEVHRQQGEIKERAIERIRTVLKPSGIVLEDLSITNILIDRSLTNVLAEEELSKNRLTIINTKQQEEETQTQIDLEIAKREKQKKIIEAEGIAEANRLINSEDITQDALRLKELEVERMWVEKWNGQAPTQTGGGFSPFQN